MSRPKKVVDLVVGEDGTYAPQKAYKKPKPTKTGIVRTPIGEKPKYLLGCDADEFLAGVDVGLDFVDAVSLRVSRFLKLRV